MEEPFSVLASQTNKPEGNDRKEDIAKRTVNPTVKHGSERSIPQSIEIGLQYLPKKVQEKTGESNRDFWYSGTPMSGQTDLSFKTYTQVMKRKAVLPRLLRRFALGQLKPPPPKARRRIVLR